MIGIYRIYHKETQKSYVGMSRDIERRIRDHFFTENRDLSIRGAIDKHGTDAFAYEILEVCQPDLLNFRECHWIASLNCIAPNGYNLTAGGDDGRMSTEIRKKMSESAKGRTPWNKGKETKKGWTHSRETRKKISEAATGRKHTPESRKKMSEAAKGRKMAPETRKKISEANKGKKRPPRSPEWSRKISESKKGKRLGKRRPKNQLLLFD